jgi:hypothetical protein
VRRPQLSHRCTPPATPPLTDDEVSDHEEQEVCFPYEALQEFDAEENGNGTQGTQVRFSPKVEYAPPTTVEDGDDPDTPAPWAQHVTKVHSDLTDLRTRWNTMANTPSCDELHTGRILTSEVCVREEHSGDLANGRRDVWQTS